LPHADEMLTDSMDFEVCSPPDDTISAMEFSPGARNLLCAASWDQTVRTWHVDTSGHTTPMASCHLSAPALDISWHDDCNRIYLATAGREVKQWDLQTQQTLLLGTHEAGVRCCHWIRTPHYCCLMTGSWDKTLKIWDPRSSSPLLSLTLPDRCYGADVMYPLAAVTCANNCIMTYSLDRRVVEYSRVESLLQQQLRCISIYRDKDGPTGFVVAGIEGCTAVHNLLEPQSNYVFRSHFSTCELGYRNIYAVNDLRHHPVHNSLVSAGSDGVYMCFDIVRGKKLFASSTKSQALTKCCFSADGQIFAYALGYDWTKGYEHYDPSKKPQIFLHGCYEQMNPKLG
ncbi:hypothetical protein KR222_004169, partial [Zaprionus bogoriensis]